MRLQATIAVEAGSTPALRKPQADTTIIVVMQLCALQLGKVWLRPV